jgi:Amt family ammonium transporter
MAVGLKYRFGFDDSLDVVGVHLVGGIVGCLAIGFFGSTAINGAYKDGLFYGGGTELLLIQAKSVGAVLAYSFIVTLVLGFILEKTIGFRLDRDAEIEGIDLVEHAETAYEFDNRGGGGLGAVLSSSRTTEGA